MAPLMTCAFWRLLSLPIGTGVYRIDDTTTANTPSTIRTKTISAPLTNPTLVPAGSMVVFAVGTGPAACWRIAQRTQPDDDCTRHSQPLHRQFVARGAELGEQRRPLGDSATLHPDEILHADRDAGQGQVVMANPMPECRGRGARPLFVVVDHRVDFGVPAPDPGEEQVGHTTSSSRPIRTPAAMLPAFNWTSASPFIPG
jgi:hypothetical protein